MSEVPSQENRQFRLDRIVEVLELLSTSKEGVLLMDIVAALGIPTSTAYKLLAEMRRVGMIEATNGRGRQRLTKRMTELGTIADRNAQKFASVEKYFDQLADELAETVYLVQLRGRLISLVGFSHPIETTGLHPGFAFPIHASAAGKILWAYQDEDLLETELKRSHIKFQDKTKVNPDEVRVALKDSLEKGYGIHDEEWDQGVLAIAVPVFLGRKMPVMAVGIVAVKDRVLKKYSIEEIVEKLEKLRDKISPILEEA